MELKAFFDASNPIRRKLYQEWYDMENGGDSFKRWLRTKQGKGQLKSMTERYTSKVEPRVNVTAVHVKGDDLTITVEADTEAIRNLRSGLIWFDEVPSY